VVRRFSAGFSAGSSDTFRPQALSDHADVEDVDALQVQSSWPSPTVAPSAAPPPAPPAPPTPNHQPPAPDLLIVSAEAKASPAPELLIVGAPTLPPSLEHEEPEDTQTPIVTRAYEHTLHKNPDLVGTGATRVLAAAGWLGSAVAYTVAAVALSKSYRHITADNWRSAFDEIRWLLPLMISSFGMAYLGWVVWATMAAINGHRVAPLASSPFMPPLAYLVGPIAAYVASVYRPESNGLWLVGGIIWVCLGHCVVLVSLRSSAKRIGADSQQFSRLFWFPVASLGYRVIATTVLPDTSFDNTGWFALLVTIDVILMMSTAVAVWRAMHSFDLACARDRYSSVENQLPAFMASVHR
jgi:hypothetical protein